MSALSPLKVAGAVFALSCVMLGTTPASAQQGDTSIAQTIPQVKQTAPAGLKSNKLSGAKSTYDLGKNIPPGCDLQMRMKTPHIGTLGTDHKIELHIKNIGTERCPSAQTEMSFHKGEGTSGMLISMYTNGTKLTRGLAPGETQVLVHTDPASHLFENGLTNSKKTYVARLEKPHDGQPWRDRAYNEFAQATVTFAQKRDVVRGCDIMVTFAVSTASGGVKSFPFTIDVVAQNRGTVACPSGQLELGWRHWKPNEVGGYVHHPIKDLPALNPGQAATFQWTDNRAGYDRKDYSVIPKRPAGANKPWNDDNNTNHRPSLVVQFAK